MGSTVTMFSGRIKVYAQRLRRVRRKYDVFLQLSSACRSDELRFLDCYVTSKKRWRDTHPVHEMHFIPNDLPF